MIKNNIKYCVLMLLCTFSISVLAVAGVKQVKQNHDPANMGDGMTRYNVVKMAFAAAGEPKYEDVVGWRSGRCYFTGKQNIPIATLLTGIKIDHGPGFDTLAGYKAHFIWHTNAVQDYYDYGGVSRTTRDMINRGHQYGSLLLKEGGSIVIHYSFATLEVRSGVMGNSGEEYLLVKRNNLKDPAFPSVSMYCYYLKEKVRY